MTYYTNDGVNLYVGDMQAGDRLATTIEVSTYELSGAVTRFTDLTTEYIEAKVRAYNQSNGLAFKDIDAFSKYAINPLSVHYNIANSFIAYADNVWSTVRAYQATATSVPTDAEFTALLDSVVF